MTLPLSDGTSVLALSVALQASGSRHKRGSGFRVVDVASLSGYAILACERRGVMADRAPCGTLQRMNAS